MFLSRIMTSHIHYDACALQGTPERLMSHLVEEHSSVDPTYVEDFLLTYRTFLKSPIEVAERLTDWFNNPAHRDKVRAPGALFVAVCVPLISYMYQCTHMILCVCFLALYSVNGGHC